VDLIVAIVCSILAIASMSAIVFSNKYWREKRSKSFDIACVMGLSKISRREFDQLINIRKFSLLKEEVLTSTFLFGTVNGINTCIFNINRGRAPANIGVFLTSIDHSFPKFVIRPKSLLSAIQHHAYPETLTNKCDVSSEDNERFAAMLTPEIIRFFLDHECISVEVGNNALLCVPGFPLDMYDYEPAIQRAHAIALLLRVSETDQGSSMALYPKTN